MAISHQDKPTTQDGLVDCRDFSEIFYFNFTKWPFVKLQNTIVFPKT
jgi:hypothetical protein